MSLLWTLVVCPPGVLAAEPEGHEAKPKAEAAHAEAQEASRIDIVRERLKTSANPDEQIAAARELLGLIDASGDGRGIEAQRLVDRLTAETPDDPLLLWRHADTRRRMEDYEGAIEDLERLLRVQPAHPLAVRARRALPSLFLRSGRREQSAQADEYLLSSNLADPSAVLSRLAKTYTLTGDYVRVRDSMKRLVRVDPDRVKVDPDMAWLEADSADRLGTRQEAGVAMLHFANLFSADPRRSEALLRAAKAYEGQGQQEFALKLMEQSVQDANTQQVEIAGRLGRGEVLETLGKRADARAEYDRVFHQAQDKDTASRALGRAVDLTVEIEGREAALAVLVSKVASGNHAAAEEGREQFARIANGMADDLAADGEKAAFVMELAKKAGVLEKIAPEIRLAAAGLHERVGAFEHAAAIYQPLAAIPNAPAGEKARAGLLRCRPRDVPAGAAANDPERLDALEREQAWTLVLKAIGTIEKNAKEPRARTLGARAAFMAGDPTWAREVLEPMKDPSPEAAVMRGDARALADDWNAACHDYRAAGGPELAPAMQGWLQLRLAACEAFDKKLDDARARLLTLISAKPAEPVLVAAEMLLERVPAAAEVKPTASRRRSAR